MTPPSIFFTADTHFGHTKIIEYCKRPFSSVEEMDETLVHNWNATIRPIDTVYHLGDFAFRRHEEYFSRLNGIKHLITGNHDGAKVRSLGWASVQPYYELEIAGRWAILCHYPFKTWNGLHRGNVNLFGHVHGGQPATHNALDVGVDCWNFRPIRMVEILQRMATPETVSNP